MTTHQSPGNFIKILQALQHVCHRTIPSIDKVVKSWHTLEKQTQKACTQPHICSTIKGKPKPSTSCAECVSWGKAVERVSYPTPNVAWRNVDTTQLHSSEIEVCNAFALHLPAGNRPTQMSDYDTASILKIMMGFGAYHLQNQATTNFQSPQETIKTMSDIRNHLCHYATKYNLRVDDQTLQAHMQVIKDCVMCLVELNHLSQQQGDDLCNDVDKIGSSPAPLTAEIEKFIKDTLQQGFQELNDKFVDSLEKMIKDIDYMKEDIKEMKGTQEGLRDAQEGLKDAQEGLKDAQEGLKDAQEGLKDAQEGLKDAQEGFKDTQEAHGTDIDSLKENVHTIKDTQQAHASEIDSLKEDMQDTRKLVTSAQKEEQDMINNWQQKLREKYKKERRKIRFGKGNQKIADTDDIFVDLSLQFLENVQIKKAISSTEKNWFELYTCILNSYRDLLRLETKSNEPYHHILIHGFAGSGKTTLLSRIAYDWARGDVDAAPEMAQKPSWAQFQLLFLLDIKKIKAGSSLEQAIRRQLLPGVSEDSLENVMSSLGDKCLVLLDGYDEVQSGADTEDSALCSPLLGTCFVIITTRPHMVDSFSSSPDKSQYCHIKLSGFSLKSSILYIEKFFKTRKQEFGSELIQKVTTTPLLCTLSSFPIVLVMMCILWEHSQTKDRAFKSLTGLYQEAVKYLNKPFASPQSSVKDIDSILDVLGKPALVSLLNNKLEIDSDEFDDEETLKKSFQIGLAYQEECDPQTLVYFIHKTFQEFCSAKYLVSLVVNSEGQSSRDEFQSYLKMIDDKNVYGMEYLLRFGCGLDIRAAEMILTHVVNLLSKHDDDERHRKQWNLPLRLLYEIETNTPTCEVTQELALALDKLTACVLAIDNHDKEFSFIFNCFLDSGACVWLQYVKLLALQYGNLDISRLFKYLKCLESLEEIRISSVSLSGDLQQGGCFKAMKRFDISHCTIPANVLQKLLSSMPIIQEVVFNDLTIDGGLESNVSFQCESVKHFGINDSKVDANTVLRLTRDMSVTKLVLSHVALVNESLIDESICCPTVLIFTLSLFKKHFDSDSPCEIDPITVLKLLTHMKALKELNLIQVNLSGELRSSMSELCRLNISGEYNKMCKVQAQTLMTFLNKMPKLEQVRLDYVSILGDLPSSDVMRPPASCQIELGEGHIKVSACTLLVLQSSVRSMLKLPMYSYMFEQLCLSGKFDPLISVSTDNSKSDLKLSRIDSNHCMFGSDIDVQCRKAAVNINVLLAYLSRISFFDKLTLSGIDITGELTVDMLVLHDQYKSFTMNEGTISAQTMMKLLAMIPSVGKVGIAVRFLETDEVYVPSVKLTNIKNASIGRIIHTTTMQKFIAAMPSLEKLKISSYFEGEIDDEIHTFCESLEEFQLVGISSRYDEDIATCEIPSQVIGSILQTMPSLKQLGMCYVKFTDKSDDVSVLPVGVNLKELQNLDIYKSEISADTLISFLCCWPKLQDIRLFEVNITGTLTFKLGKLCSSIQRLNMARSTIDVDTLLRYLGCMPSLETVVFGNVVNLNKSHDPQECVSIKEFSMYRVTIDVNALMILLSHMPLLEQIELGRMCLTGELTETLTCKSVFQFKMEGGSVHAKTLLIVLGSMPILKDIALKEIELKDEIDEDLPVLCRCVEQIEMLDMDVNVNTFNQFLQCMPSLTKVTVSTLKGELNATVNGSCEKLKEFHILKGDLSAVSLFGVLRYMPALQVVKFQKLEIQGTAEDMISVPCVVVFVLIECSVKVTVLFKLLSFMSSLQIMVLNTISVQDERRIPRCHFQLKKVTETRIQNTSMKYSVISQLLHSTPALQTVTLNTVTFSTEETSKEITAEGMLNDLVQFTIENGTVSALILQSFLKSMPFLKKLNLCRMCITGEMDQELTVTCREITEFEMSGSDKTLCANTLTHILACMPSLERVNLFNTNIALGSVTDNFISMIGQHIKNMTIFESCVDPNALIRIMSCMPVLEKVDLNVDLTSDIDNRIVDTQYYCTVTRLTYTVHTWYEPIHLALFLELLAYMPQVKFINVKGIDLSGELNSPDEQLCKHLKSIWILSNKFNIETLSRFLACTQPEYVALDIVEHVGNFDTDVPLSSTCDSLKELHIRHISSTAVSDAKSWTISINALVKGLHCMPGLEVLHLNKPDIIGKLDPCIPKLGSRIKTFQMTDGSLSSAVLANLLEVMPHVENMTIGKLTDHTDVKGPVSKSLRALNISTSEDITIHANTVVGFIGQMPSLEDLTVEKISGDGEVHDNILVDGKSVRAIHMKNCSFNADVIIRLLRRAQNIEKITLEDVAVQNVSLKPVIACESVKGFNMISGSISEYALMKLLGCMPKMHKLTLHNLTNEVSQVYWHSVMCSVLRELAVSESVFKASLLANILQCMPSLQKIVMKNIKVEGEIDSDVEFKLSLLREYQMESSSISADTLLTLIHCLPALRTIDLDSTIISGTVGTGTLTPNNSVKKFRLCNDTQRGGSSSPCKVSAHSLFQSIGCLVALKELHIDGVQLEGELNADIQIRCKNLKKVVVKGGCVSANVITTFLGSVESVEILVLGNSTGEITVDSSTFVTLLKEFDVIQERHIGSCSADQLIQFLQVMPLLKRLSIRAPSVTYAGTSTDLRCEHLQEIDIGVTSCNTYRTRYKCTLEADTVLKFCEMSPILGTLKLKHVKVAGIVTMNSTHLNSSLTVLLVVNVAITAKNLLQYLIQMPALENLTLEAIDLAGKLESDSTIVCKFLKVFNLSGLKENNPIKISAMMLATMPSLVTLKLGRFEVIGDLVCDLPHLGKSLTRVHLSDGKIHSVSFSKYLLKLPSLKTWHMSGIILMYFPAVFSKSLQEFSWTKCTSIIKVNRFVRILQCMPYLRKIAIPCRLEGTFPSNEPKWKYVKEIECSSLGDVKVDLNTVISVMHCMPSLEQVVFSIPYGCFDGELPLCNKLNWKELKELYMICASGKADILTRFLTKMPVLKTLVMYELTITANDLLKLLSSMTLLEVLKAYHMTVTSDVDVQMTCNTLSVCELANGKFCVKSLMDILECMVALTQLSLQNVELNDSGSSVVRSKSRLCLKELKLTDMKLEFSTLMCMLECMPELKNVLLDPVEIQGRIEHSTYNSFSIEEMAFRCVKALDSNVPLLLLHCMPCIEKMTLDANLTGEINVNIHPQCRKLKDFTLRGQSNVNVVVQYLNCMPALERILINQNMTGELEENMMITCQGIKEFTSLGAVKCSFLEELLIKQERLTKLSMRCSGDLKTSDKFKLMSIVRSVASTLKVVELEGVIPVIDIETLPDDLMKVFSTCLADLQQLCLPNADMTERQCEQLLDMLNKVGTERSPSGCCLPLQWIDLSGNVMSDSIGKLIMLVSNLKNLKGLCLSKCCLEEHHFQQLGPSLVNMKHLEHLDLSENDGVSFLFSSDLSKFLNSIKVLKLSDAGIVDEDLHQLSFSQMQNMEELDLSCNLIGNYGVEFLMKSDRHQCITPELSDVSVSAGSQSVIALKKLSLRACKSISGKGIEDIFRNLASFPDLTELDLCGISLPYYECLPFPRLCAYLKASGQAVNIGPDVILHDVLLSCYEVDDIKAIQECSFDE